LALLVVACLAIGYRASRPPEASASDEALKAAAEIRARQGGGEQKKTEQGVPVDAVVDPNAKPGPIAPSKGG
jgi:hypothetical protein